MPSTRTSTPAGNSQLVSASAIPSASSIGLRVDGPQQVEALAHDGHGFGRASLNLIQIVREIWVGLQGGQALVLNALDAHRHRADLVVDAVQQVGGDVAHRGKGLSQRALFFSGTQRVPPRRLDRRQRGVVRQHH